MTELHVTAVNADEQMKLLYESAFPEEEQIPWDDLMRLIGEMSLDFTAYYDDVEQSEQQKPCTALDSTGTQRKKTKGRFIGFTIVYPCKMFLHQTNPMHEGERQKVNWFWYFAVCEELRGKGYGQQILSCVMERYQGQANVFDMESPHQDCDNIAQRKRRYEFYLRNGFRDTNVYRNYDDIEMTMMMMGQGDFTMQDWDDIVSELRQYWTWDEEEEQE